jgi:hypothetical protein
MTRKLRIAEDQTLPIDAITQRISVLGRTGSGKSHTAMVVVEEVLALHQQVVVLDPKGDFWGLRSSADGKGPGYPITVFGGEHGDIPLDPTSGMLVADLIIREGISAILDMSMFESKAEENRFATDFADRLYRKNRKAMLFVIDEADGQCPQNPMPEERRMLSKFDVICRRGRSRGIGVMLISQRSAAIHKGCLSQTELMLAHQTTAPQDRKAVELWVKGKGTEEQQKQFMSRLASLKTGEAILWSPSWLNIFKEIKIRDKRTYDSSATPTVGARRRAPKVLAKIDLERLKKHLASTLEQAKQEDPKLLRERIAELEKKVRDADRFREAVDKKSKSIEQKLDKVQPQVQKMVERLVEKTKVVEKIKRVKVEVPLLKKRQYKELEKLMARCEKLMSHLDSAGMRFEVFSRCLWPDISNIKARLDEMKNIKPTPTKQTLMERVFPKPAPVVEKPRKAIVTKTEPAPDVEPTDNELSQKIISGEAKLKDGQRRMLKTLATYHPEPLPRAQLGPISTVSPTSGTFSSYLSTLRKCGFISEDAKEISISRSGFEHLKGDFEQHPPTTDERVANWGPSLKDGQRRMLDVLVQAKGEWVSKEDLGQASGINPTSGTFSSYLSTLRRNGLAEDERGKVRACSALFV